MIKWFKKRRVDNQFRLVDLDTPEIVTDGRQVISSYNIKRYFTYLKESGFNGSIFTTNDGELYTFVTVGNDKFVFYYGGDELKEWRKEQNGKGDKI